jgi:4-amino-4-deoxy-L-arabinose transferase-like glycosyltransferase
VIAFGRIALLVIALVVATEGYRDSFGPLPWWHWIGELFAGCVALTIALWQRAEATDHGGRRAARALCGVVSVAAFSGLAIWGPQPGLELRAGVAAGVALGAFLLARWRPFTSTEVTELAGGLAAVEPLRWWRWLIAVVAVTAGVLAAYLNQTQHVAAFLLWLLSLALFVAAMWQRGAPPAAASWRQQAGPELSARAAAIGSLLVLTLAAALRMSALADFPAAIDPDEGRQGRTAERIWQHGFPNAFSLGWNVFPTLSYMVEYTGVQLWGTSNASLRFSAALIGVLSIVPVFFWAQRWWGNVVALLTALLLAINRDHLAFSRVALNNIHQVLVAGLVLAAFARVLRTGRRIDWVWFGYAVGLGFHTYHAAKLYPALIAVIALLLAIGIRGFSRRYAGGAIVGAIAFLLCFGPLMVAIYQNWNFFYASTSDRVDLYVLREALARGDLASVRAYLWTHIGWCLLMFTAVPPEMPTFSGWVAVPFLLGVGWMLWHWRDPRHLSVLVWAGGILAIGGMITGYPPNKPRLLGMLPAICVIPAVIAGRMRAALLRWQPRVADAIAVPALLLWIVAATHATWEHFFVYLPPLQGGDTMTEICRTLDNAPLPATVYMAGGAIMAEPLVASNDCMLAPNPQRTVVNLGDDPAIVPIPPNHHGNAVLMVGWPQQELLPLIRHYYPDAVEVVRTQQGKPQLWVFTLPLPMIEKQRGLRATYHSSTRTWMLADGVDTFAAPADATAGDFPLDATWRGQVWIAQPGPYAFRVSGGTLRIGGKPIATEVITLPAGWHAIELTARLEAPADRVALEWRLSDAAEFAPVARALLHTHPETHGLLARWFNRVIASTSAQPIAEPPDYTRIDAVVSFDYYEMFDQRPAGGVGSTSSTTEWVGSVALPEATAPALRLRSTGPAQVFLNGQLVASTDGQVEPVPLVAELPVPRGRVPILVRATRLADKWERWKLQIEWRDAGAGWTAFVDYHPEP